MGRTFIISAIYPQILLQTQKFKALSLVSLKDPNWIACPSEWREPFLPASKGAWATFPLLDDFFVYNGSGVMPGRTWIIAPDTESLQRRWQTLVTAPSEQQETLFHPHLCDGHVGDKHSKKIGTAPLPGLEPRPQSVADDQEDCVEPVRYAPAWVEPSIVPAIGRFSQEIYRPPKGSA